MAAQTAPPRSTALENFYTVGEAAVRLGLKTPAEHEAGSTKGQRWLRDGVNLKGWPCHRMNGQLLFSDSDLAEIAQMHSNAPEKRGRRPRPRRRTTSPAPATAAA